VSQVQFRAIYIATIRGCDVWFSFVCETKTLHLPFAPDTGSCRKTRDIFHCHPNILGTAKLQPSQYDGVCYGNKFIAINQLAIKRSFHERANCGVTGYDDVTGTLQSRDTCNMSMLQVVLVFLLSIASLIIYFIDSST